jgi:cytochrome P450
MEILNAPVPAVPQVPAGAGGIAWLRATVSRFSNGPVHARRRALVTGLLAGVDAGALRSPSAEHPVARLASALGVDAPVVDDVRAAAAAYHSGDPAADAAVDRLVGVFGGAYDERTAAHICLLVQACDATTTLIERARTRPVEEVLRDAPPVAATRRLGPGGAVVLVPLAGDTAFGAGPRACPGRAHALALVEGALR